MKRPETKGIFGRSLLSQRRALIPIPARAQSRTVGRRIWPNLFRNIPRPAERGMCSITEVGYVKFQNQKSPKMPDEAWMSQAMPVMVNTPSRNTPHLAVQLSLEDLNKMYRIPNAGKNTA